MTETIVLDASALIAIALHEPGGEAVLDRIESASGNALIHAVNVFEVASKLMAKGVPEAEAWESADFGGIMRIEDVGDHMVRSAVRLKQANPQFPFRPRDNFLAEEIPDVPHGGIPHIPFGFFAEIVRSMRTVIMNMRSAGGLFEITEPS